MTLAVLAAGSSACASESEIDCERYEFSSREWHKTGKQLERRDDDAALKSRRRAADALVKCRLLRNKTKKQVRNIVGDPSMRVRAENAWFYTIGEERGPFSVDEEVLAIKFKRNRVAKVKTEVW